MPVQSTSTDPWWTFDVTEIESQVATYAKNNGIVDQAAWDAHIASLTSAQAVAAVKGLLRAMKCKAP